MLCINVLDEVTQVCVREMNRVNPLQPKLQVQVAAGTPIY